MKRDMIKNKTYHHDISRSVLNGSKQTQYNNYYMKKISKNRRPLEAKEVKDLPL